MSEGVDLTITEYLTDQTGRATVANEVQQVLARLHLTHSESAGLILSEEGLVDEVRTTLENLPEPTRGKVKAGDIAYRAISSRLYQECNSEEEIRREAAYQILFEVIYRYIWAKTRPERHLAEDLTNDTLLKIIEKLETCRSPYFFLKWAEQIAYHNVAQHFRDRLKAPTGSLTSRKEANPALAVVSRVVNFDPEEAASPVKSTDPEQMILAQEQRLSLIEKIAGLKSTTRRARAYKVILIGTYFLGLTDLELAAKLKLTPPEIQKRRYQALRLLHSDQNWLNQLK